MKHRIFIAINLPENIKKKLISYQEKTEELFTPYRAEGSGAGPCRWTKKENLHITLAFLGYLTDEEVVEICKNTKEVASKYEPFFINLNKIIYGPPASLREQARLRSVAGGTPNNTPRMIWVEGEESEELGKLQQDLESALASSDLSTEAPGAEAEALVKENTENRPYAPHITLGRLKQWEFRKIEPEERPQINEEISLGFDIESIEIMESELKKGGPEYAVLESAPLRG